MSYILLFKGSCQGYWAIDEFVISDSLDYLQLEAQGKNTPRIFALGEQIPVRSKRRYDLGV